MAAFSTVKVAILLRSGADTHNNLLRSLNPPLLTRVPAIL